MTDYEDVNGNEPTIVAPAAGSIFPTNSTESLRQQNSRGRGTPAYEAGALPQEARSFVERLPGDFVLTN
jgi:hypothetical protein